MNNYFYNSRDKEYFSILSRDTEFLDISVIEGKRNSQKTIEDDLFKRRCFSVKKMPKHLLLNKNSFTISPKNDSSPDITIFSNSIINYDNIDNSVFMMSVSNRDDSSAYDIVTSLNFRNTAQIIEYLDAHKIIDKAHLEYLNDYEITDSSIKNTRKLKQRKQIKS